VTQHDHIDPFEAMRLDDGPVAPRPGLAAELRARLAAALAEGDPEMTTTLAPAPTSVTATPYLTVRGGVAALDFYRDAFGAVEDHRMLDDQGRVGHAAFAIGSAEFYLSDEHPEIGVLGPESLGGATCAFSLNVPDVDATYERAVAHGATPGRPPADEFYGRAAWVTDPFGHRWNLAAQRGVATADYDAAATAGGYRVERAHDAQIKHYEPGDLYYFTLPVPDLAKAQAFFGEVLGWHFDDPSAGHVDNIAAPPGGVRPTDAPRGAELWFVVADIHRAVDAVRRSGGTASEPVLSESGWAAECTDDQGTRFNLSVPSPRYSR
jgi:uncharacterized glyoxalase superfamily protein PhnB